MRGGAEAHAAVRPSWANPSAQRGGRPCVRAHHDRLLFALRVRSSSRFRASRSFATHASSDSSSKPSGRSIRSVTSLGILPLDRKNPLGRFTDFVVPDRLHPERARSRPIANPIDEVVGERIGQQVDELGEAIGGLDQVDSVRLLGGPEVSIVRRRVGRGRRVVAIVEAVEWGRQQTRARGRDGNQRTDDGDVTNGDSPHSPRIGLRRAGHFETESPLSSKTLPLHTMTEASSRTRWVP